MCFRKAFHLTLMHFIHYIQCFVEYFQKSGCFSLKFCFSIFSIDPICFRSIEIYFKILGEPSSISIDRNYFPINRILWIRFLKKIDLDFFKITFSKFSKLLSFSLSLSLSLSLSSIRTWLHLRFLSFFIILFARFLSPNTGKTFLPFFLLLFSHFMHFNLGILNLYIFGVFDDSGHNFWNWSLGFVPMMLLTWSLLKNLINLENLWKIKNSRACIEPDLGILFNLV